MAGAVSGALSRCLVAPLDVIKIRMQLERGTISAGTGNISDTRIKAGMLRTTQKLLAEEGIVSLWRGNIPAMLLWVCYAGVQFPVYGALKRGLSSPLKSEKAIEHQGTLTGKRGPSSHAVMLLSGAAAATIATCASYPLDWARTRMASQGIPKAHNSILSLMRYTLSKEVCQLRNMGFHTALICCVFE